MKETEKLEKLERESRLLDWNGDQARTGLGQAVEAAAAFLDSVPEAPAYHDLEGPVLGDPVPEGPCSVQGVLESYRQLSLQSGVNPVSGRFMGYVPGGGLPTAAMGDLLAGITNRYAGVYLASPGAVAIENQVVAWIRDLMGLPKHAWGTLTSGGTLATLTGLVAARSQRTIHRWPKSAIYSTPEAHACLDKSIRIAGLDCAVRRLVEVDKTLRMKPAALRSQIAADRAAGLEPWIVCATAGTVNTGAIDPIAQIADICQELGLWLHVDGAYGGFFALTEEGAKKLAGIERADSLVLDPHKGLFQRYGCGAVLVRDGRILERAMAYRADYLADVEDEQHPSPADYSMELTRHFRGLGLWMSLKIHGLERFRAALEEKQLLAQYAHGRLSEIPGIQVGRAPELSIVTFRAESGDESTRALLDTILRRGRVHLSSTKLGGVLWIRICVLCFRSHRADIDAVIDEIKASLSSRS